MIITLALWITITAPL
jgi:hypothetical protein